MTFLLDTQILLWAAGEPTRLPPPVRKLLADPQHDLVFSVASLWEISVKRALGRSDFIVEPRVLRRSLLDNGYRELVISGEHALGVESLPPLHRDPFDRLLVAQATAEGITLLTHDAQLAAYPGPIRLV